ncbi:MAG TPA: beta-propeller fold lactonase family protein [Candidatus Binataceae bacterium]|nr:beta-propeller fold lactonase family protein [Candidatus Binataceae bacterium]
MRIAGVLKLAPALAAIAVGVVLTGGACGRSIFPAATNSTTATPTGSPSPTTGHFLYTSNTADGKVAEFKRNLTTGALTLAGSVGAGSVNGPIGITNGPGARFIYVANSTDSNVRQYKIDLSNGLLASIGTIPAGTSPQWIAVSPTATFAFTTNFSAGTISPYTIDSTTGVLTANGSAFLSSLLTNPSGAVATASFLYVTDEAQGTVANFPITSTGTLLAGTSTFLTTLGFGSPSPGPMIIDPTGQFVYATDLKLGVVYFLTVGTNGVLNYVNTYQSSNAAEGGLVFVPTTGATFLYVANQQATPPSISAFQVQSGILTFSATYTDPSLKLPTGLAVDPTDTFLYVTNQGAGTVTQFTITAGTGVLTKPVVFKTESATSGPLYIAIAN